MNLFFDTETTGLPPKGAKWDINPELFPKIASLSWKMNGVMKDYIIKPEGYEIPEESTKIHGITTEKAMDEGILFDIVMAEFSQDCIIADKVIGHNIYFDSSVIKANFLTKYGNAGLLEIINRALHKDKRICTMMKTISFCSIPFKNTGKGKKWPTLEELYAKLFNGETFAAHNSKDDVLATERCFNELVRLGVIQIVS